MSSVTPSGSFPKTSRRGPWRRTSEDNAEGIFVEDIQLGTMRRQAEAPFMGPQKAAVLHHLGDRHRSRTLVTWSIAIFVFCVAGYCFTAMAHFGSVIILYILQNQLSVIREHFFTSTWKAGSTGTRQFEAIIEGVEHCELRFKLTSATSTSRAAPQDSTFSISVFQLEYFEAMDENTISRSDPPSRMINLRGIDITPGLPIDWRESFNCAQNAVLAFEFACTENESKDRCSVEWWQQRFLENPDNIF
ncbi:hypothetical protein CVT25_004587 [Psilocybe cyanescens]|uniref:Ubiquitin 3 binding protein But2 C-terminal domain-containing protein n=1 Tax=Psilocybe cyanescens TaxID=93625 RepID=A0A409X2E4_PSICY|nr:hypothetical protein CVT25_004587 [Psilocybe cyanescens]